MGATGALLAGIGAPNCEAIKSKYNNKVPDCSDTKGINAATEVTQHKAYLSCAMSCTYHHELLLYLRQRTPELPAVPVRLSTTLVRL
jgi:hypothetical protein